MISSSSFGKELLPYLSGKFNIQPLSDVVDILSKDSFIRPIYAGSALSVYESKQSINMMTVRSISFEENVKDSNEELQIEKLEGVDERLNKI